MSTDSAPAVDLLEEWLCGGQGWNDLRSSDFTESDGAAADRRIAFDPRTVAVPSGSGALKYKFARDLIVSSPPDQRPYVAHVLLRRIPIETKNLWRATEHLSADGGRFWIGLGNPFILALDPAGRAFEGFGPDIIVLDERGAARANYQVLNLVTARL